MHGSRQQRRGGRRCQAIGGNEHLRHLRRLDDHGAPIRAQPGKVEWVWHEASWFCSLSEETELADDQLATAPGRGREVCKGCAPVIKSGLVEIDSFDACEEVLQMLENLLLAVEAPPQGALMRKPRRDRPAQRCW